MADAHAVADYFLVVVTERGERIRHLRLAAGSNVIAITIRFYAALFDRPLFTQPIYAWWYGPVVRDLWV